MGMKVQSTKPLYIWNYRSVFTATSDNQLLRWRIQPKTGTVMRIFLLVMGPDDWAATRNITVGQFDKTTSSTNLVALWFPTTAVDNERHQIPLGPATTVAANGLPATPYGIVIPAGDEIQIFTDANLDTSETFTLAIRAILSDYAKPTLVISGLGGDVETYNKIGGVFE